MLLEFPTWSVQQLLANYLDLGTERKLTIVEYLLCAGQCAKRFYFYDVSYGIVMYSLYYVEVCSLRTHFVESFFS